MYVLHFVNYNSVVCSACVKCSLQCQRLRAFIEGEEGKKNMAIISYCVAFSSSVLCSVCSPNLNVHCVTRVHMTKYHHRSYDFLQSLFKCLLKCETFQMLALDCQHRMGFVLQLKSSAAACLMMSENEHTCSTVVHKHMSIYL